MEQQDIVRLLYYIEVNLVCISVLSLLLYQFRSYASGKKTERIVLRNIMICCIAFCLCDTAAIVFRGRTFPGAHALVWFSNSFYFISSSVMCSMWTEYAIIVTNKEQMRKKSTLWLLHLPTAVMTVLVLMSSFNGWIFTVDENNVYHRGKLVMLHWIICLGHLAFTSGMVLIRTFAQKTRSRRKAMIPICLFSVAPFVCGVCQIFFYGTTLIQAGLTFSVLLVVLRIERAQISVDDLTGLNNRHEFNTYIERVMSGDKNDPVYLLMLDINQFKQINDTYGHISGDEALSNAAVILKRSCGGIQHRAFLARYGGDEFVIVGSGTRENARQFIGNIERESEAFNSLEQEPYVLRFSIGCAAGRIGDFATYDELIRQADEQMYEQKRKFKAAQTGEKASGVSAKK